MGNPHLGFRVEGLGFRVGNRQSALLAPMVFGHVVEAAEEEMSASSGLGSAEGGVSGFGFRVSGLRFRV